jgi:hypothetical protein
MSGFEGLRVKPRYGLSLCDGSTLGRYEVGADPIRRERLRGLVGGLGIARVSPNP